MSFLSSVQEVAARVKESLQEGAVTPYYGLNLTEVYNVLQAALASEIVCVLRYQQHYYMTTSVHKNQIQDVFKEHWQDEQDHQNRIAERLQQLGGIPNLNPEGATSRGFSSFESGHSLVQLLCEDLLAERVVVKMYGDIVNFFGHADPVSRRIFEDLLKDEQDHASDIADLLYTIDPASGQVVDDASADAVLDRPLATPH